MPPSPRRLAGSARRSRAAFTLIELLTVMAIILVLAGLVLGISGLAQSKAGSARAETEIKAMETAIELYRTDNGAYPRDSVATDGLNAQSDTDTDPVTGGSTLTSTGTSGNKYLAASHFLYKQLSGINTESSNAMTKSYMTFSPNQLSTSNAAPSAQTYIIDPFGFSYGYSTAAQAAADLAATNNTAVDTTKGYNPTFDLWSTVGYSGGGKSYPNGISTAALKAPLWKKNW